MLNTLSELEHAGNRVCLRKALKFAVRPQILRRGFAGLQVCCAGVCSCSTVGLGKEYGVFVEAHVYRIQESEKLITGAGLSVLGCSHWLSLFSHIRVSVG